MKYDYETHLHTAPASGCAKWSAAEAVKYYTDAGYAGIFITNHVLDDDVPEIRALPYEVQIELYFQDVEAGIEAGREVGLSVFSGVEVSYLKTDFLIYGLDKAWFLNHPEIDAMPIKDFLALARENGALIVHAHPFREANSIDHIRLYPRSVQAVEIHNANRSEFENTLALWYAENYSLLHFAGSDIHGKEPHGHRAGMCCETEVSDEQEFVKKVLSGQMQAFSKDIIPFSRG